MIYIRKYILFAAFAVVALIVAACSSAESLTDDTDNTKPDNRGTHTVTLTASVGSTRMGMTNNGDGTVSFYWHKGDEIGVQAKNKEGLYEYVKFTTNAPTGSTTATFTGEVPDGYDVQQYAVYPYMPIKVYDQAINKFTGDKSMDLWMTYLYDLGKADSVLFPITRDGETIYSAHGTNMPMVGTITDGTISFKHLAGMLVIRVDKMPENRGTVAFTAEEKLNGFFTISDLSAQDVQIKSEDSTDGLSYTGFNFGACDVGKPAVFFMPLPVGTYTNCKIYVNEQIIACESITIARGQVRSLSITTNSHGQLRNIRSLGDNRYMVNGQKFIDLGLESGLLWAECNIGATRDKLSGNFYAWGETETKTSYTIDNAKWQQTEYTAGTTLTAEDDVATVLYGTAVHIPTRADFNELSNLKRICYSEYDDAERTNLYFFKMTSKLDSSQELYLPLSGVMDGTSLSSKNIEGDYWTSEPCSTLTYEYRTAYYLLGMKTKNGSSAWTPGSFDIEPVPLYRGLNIRPVTYK